MNYDYENNFESIKIKTIENQQSYYTQTFITYVCTYLTITYYKPIKYNSL